MPKVTIEIDLPEGQAIPDPRDVLRLTSPDWMASWWHIDDVQSFRDYDENDPERLSDEEAREVLRLMDKYHDCEIGINWDVIDNWIDHVTTQRTVHKNDCKEFLELSGSEEYLDDPAILLNIVNIGEKA